MFQYKLESIRLRSGTEIKPGKLTVVVGPNNSGKSRLLRDVKVCATQNRNSRVVDAVSHNRPTSVEDLFESYDIRPYLDPVQGTVRFVGLDADMSAPTRHTMYPGTSSDWNTFIRSTVQQWLDSWDDGSVAAFTQHFGNYFVARLTTETRLLITNEAQSGDPQREVSNLLQAFYREGKVAEQRLSDLVYNAFENLRIKLDYSGLSTLRFRVGESFDHIPDDPRDARPLLETFDRLDDQGDGIRSFVATVLALLVGARPILLLDEPEAFLHPSQAPQLGAIIADQAAEDRQIIVATHSVDVLRGILNRRSDIDVVRLSRNSDDSKVTILSAEEVREIANDPLLSSTRILDGLFYKGVVAVEADSDSAFYQRVARDRRPGDEIHYAHAHNKQTLRKVVGPYEKMGVGVAAVADFDILKREDEFSSLLRAKTYDSITRKLDAREQIRTEVEDAPPLEKLETVTYLARKHCR